MKNVINLSIDNSDEVIEWLEGMKDSAERMLALVRKMPGVEINAVTIRSDD